MTTALERIATSEPIPDSSHHQPAPGWYIASLTFASVVGTLLILPYATELMQQLPSAVQQTRPSFTGRTYGLVLETSISLVLVISGLALGRPLGLGWPPLRAWKPPRSVQAKLSYSLALSVLLGVALAIVVGSLATALPAPPQSNVFAPPSWNSALLASVGAGLREEIWLRLGLMSIFAGAISRVGSRHVPDEIAVWSANVAAALVFGAMHLPFASSIAPLTATAVLFILAGNGLVGLACGWLYWRLGIVAAIVSHACVDIVLKVLPALWGAGAA